MSRLALSMLLVFVAGWILAAQQPAERRFDEQSWREIKEGIDYGSYQREMRERQKMLSDGSGDAGERPERSHYDSGYQNEGFMLPAGGQFFMYILFIVVLLLILYVFLKNSRFRNRSISYDRGKIDFENIEEKIHETDLDSLLREAIKHNDFVQAIRLLYLNIIKELTSKGFIDWEKDKTNRDYLNELTNGDLRMNFEKITLLFEWAWYGDALIDQKTYAQLETKFRDFKYAVDHIGK